MWAWLTRKTTKAQQIVEPVVTVTEKISELTIYLSNDKVLKCSAVIVDGETELTPYNNFHQWMMGPATSNAFYLIVSGGGYYVKREHIIAYTIISKNVERLA